MATAEYPVAGLQTYPRWIRLTKRFIRAQPGGFISLLVVAILAAAGLLAPVLSRFDPLDPQVAVRLSPPSQQFWFGTDNLGRDVFSRTLWGARTSLFIGFVSVGAATVLGSLVGIVSGYVGGKLDLIAQRAVDILMSFPVILLALALMASQGPGVPNVITAIAITMAPRFARIARGSVLSIKEEPYVLAAQAIGCDGLRVMWVHIVPNSLAPIFILAAGTVGSAIIIEASLSFLGMGVPVHTPSWGGDLSYTGKQFFEVAPWLVIFPGSGLTLTVLAVNLLGDALRDFLDPRLRGGA